MLPTTAQPELALEVTDEERGDLLNALLALPIEKLAEMASAALDALDDAEAATGDDKPTAEQMAALVAYAETAQQALLAKPDKYVGFLHHLDRQETELAAEVVRLEKRKKVFRHKRERMEQRLKLFIESTPNKRIETARYTVSLAKLPAKANITNLDKLPENFKTIVPAQTTIVPEHVEADRKAIVAVLKLNKPVEGAELVQEYRLQIR